MNKDDRALHWTKTTWHYIEQRRQGATLNKDDRALHWTKTTGCYIEQRRQGTTLNKDDRALHWTKTTGRYIEQRRQGATLNKDDRTLHRTKTTRRYVEQRRQDATSNKDNRVLHWTKTTGYYIEPKDNRVLHRILNKDDRVQYWTKTTGYYIEQRRQGTILNKDNRGRIQSEGNHHDQMVVINWSWISDWKFSVFMNNLQQDISTNQDEDMYMYTTCTECTCFTLSPRRPYEEYKRMVLEHTHGLFIT